ncbi:MAG: phosphoribosylformylglycinamidine cyclo-ligase [Clostridiaceae bacterium]
MVNYKEAGVNIEEGYKTVGLIKEYAKETYDENVLNGLGSFAALYALKDYKNPILVSGTDGVGTKLKIAFDTNIYDTVGIDCVAMCVNDILCQGAKPLFFLDYMACGMLESSVAADIVKGVANGCKMANSSLIGGETAEMPGFYKKGEYDLAGFAVGVCEKDKIINGDKIKEGDVLIGIASSGVHSNGFSLVRKLVTDLKEDFNGEEIGKVLLTPTKIYVKTVSKLLEKYDIKGMAHITGGGFYENIPRMYSKNLTAVVKKDSFEILPVFKYLMDKGVSENDMFNTFNMGIGFVLCVDPKDADNILNEIDDTAYKIGYMKAGGEGICLE